MYVTIAMCSEQSARLFEGNAMAPTFFLMPTIHVDAYAMLEWYKEIKEPRNQGRVGDGIVQ